MLHQLSNDISKSSISPQSDVLVDMHTLFDDMCGENQPVGPFGFARGGKKSWILDTPLGAGKTNQWDHLASRAEVKNHRF